PGQAGRTAEDVPSCPTRRSSDLKVELEVVERVKAWLEQGKNVREMGLTKEELPAVADMFLLTIKPTLYVANVDEASMHTGNKYSDRKSTRLNSSHVKISYAVFCL